MRKRIQRLVLVIAVFSVFLIPVAVNAASDGFTDVDDTSVFKADIDWLADAGVTKGCNPPGNTLFCPKDTVTRETMAAFMHRLAVNKVVDAKTAETAKNADNADTLDGKDSTEFLGKSEKAADSDTLDGKDSSAFIEYGPIVTTIGGAAWLPRSNAPSTIERFTSHVRVSGDGAMVVGVQAPVSFNGVEYGLASIEICLDVEDSGFLSQVSMFRTDTATSTPQILADETDRTVDGCYVYDVGRSVARGAGIRLTFSGGGTIRIEGTTLTWTTDAFVTSALSSSATTEGLNG